MYIETAQLTNRKEKLLNKDVLFNKKAQNTIGIAERIFRTWEAKTYNYLTFFGKMLLACKNIYFNLNF